MPNKKIILNSEYFSKIQDELKTESDRAVAIIIGAEIDNALIKFLRENLRKKNKNGISLFSSTAPLGNFAARIEILYRLKIIDEIVHHDLHLLRNIRNKFAHGTHGLKFSSEKISKKIKEFKFISKFKKEKGIEIPRVAFLLITAYLIGRFSVIEEEFITNKK
ncbi:MAG: MltR family transcriptional regulator [Candidatus Omnitrophota bacterium]